MTDETLDFQVLIEIEQTTASFAKFEDQVQQVRDKLNELRQAGVDNNKTFSNAFDDAIADMKKFGAAADDDDTKIRKLGKNFSVTASAVREGTKRFTDEFKKYGSELDTQTAKTSKFGDVAKFVFGSILGISAVAAIRKIVDLMKEAVAAGEQWSRTLFQLEVGVRALQRRGVETTIGAFREEVARLQSLFPIFTVQELEQGISEIALFTRELGFTEEQILKVNEASIVLAQLTGRNVADASRMVAVALSSGYTEGLQRLGLAITKVQIEQEAMRLGFEGSIQTMDTATKAAATYNLIIQQSADLAEDATKFQDTYAGSIQESKTRMETLRDTVGARVLPTFAKLLDILTFLIETLIKANQWAVALGLRGFETLAKATLRFGKAMEDVLNMFLGTEFSAFQDAFDNLTEFFQDAVDAVLDPASALEAGLGDLVKEVKNAGRELGRSSTKTPGRDLLPLPSPEGVDEAFEKLSKAVDDAMSDMASKIKAENVDLQDDLNDITEKGLDKQADIWTDFYQKLEDITQKETDKIADAQADLQFSLQDLQRDTAQKIADAQRKAREKEEEEEAKLLDNLRKLREKFLFDLEDAIRNRDVRQALRLQRRFEMDKGNIVSDAENRRQSAQTELANELADIRANAARKAAQLKLENQRRIAEIRLQAERERAEANIWRERQERDLAESLDRQREARQKKHEQELRDIDTQARERIQKVIDGLEQEFEVTAQFMQAIVNLFAQVYGSGGVLSQIVQGFNSSLPTTSVTRTTVPAGIRGFAQGGTFIADKPTLVLAGEGDESEVVDIRPMSQVNRNVGTAPQADNDGNIALSIMLDSGLVGEIVELSSKNVQVSIEQVSRRRR